MSGLGNQHSRQWAVADPMRAARMEAINSEFSDIRQYGGDRGQVRESKGSLVDSCDVVTGWAASGVCTILSINSSKYLEGAGSLKLGASGAGTITATKTLSSTDMSSAIHLFSSWWMDYGVKDFLTSVTVKIGSDSSNYKYATISFSDPDFGNWKALDKILISGMSDNGTPNMSAVTYFAVDLVVTAAIGAGDILLDDIRSSQLSVDIGAFTANVGGTVVNYGGITEQVLTVSATNYIMLTAAGTLYITTTGFIGANAQIAIVVCTAVISSIALKRSDIIGGDFGASVGRTISPESVDPDTKAMATQQMVGNNNTIVFTNTVDKSIWFNVLIPYSFSAGTDILLRLSYDMRTAETSKNVKIDMDYWIVQDGGDVTPASPTGSTSDTIVAPNAAEILDVYVSTNNKIIPAHVQPGRMLTVKLTRDVSVASGHTGALRIFNIEMYQA